MILLLESSVLIYIIMRKYDPMSDISFDKNAPSPGGIKIKRHT
jgi:hypothetical protein